MRPATRPASLRGEANLRNQIAALDAQAADRDAYLRLAGDLEGFLARLRASTATATTEDRRRVLRALVQDILIGPEKITIRHRIPVREPSSGGGHNDTTDTEGHMRNSYLLRWGVPAPLRGVLCRAGTHVPPLTAEPAESGEPGMTIRLGSTVINSTDPDLMTSFWSEAQHLASPSRNRGPAGARDPSKPGSMASPDV